MVLESSQVDSEIQNNNLCNFSILTAFSIISVIYTQHFLTDALHNLSRSITTQMAPRQRNISPASTPSQSEEETFSDDGSDTSLVQEEKVAPSSKPTKTLNVTEADKARDNHDYFNIVALAIVVATCALNYEYPSFSYTGEYFWTMWAVSSSTLEIGLSKQDAHLISTFVDFAVMWDVSHSLLLQLILLCCAKYIDVIGDVDIFLFGFNLGRAHPDLRKESGSNREGMSLDKIWQKTLFMNLLLCHLSSTQHNLTVMQLVYSKASYCRYDIPVSTNLLSSFSMVDGSHFIGRIEHMVLNLSPFGLSKQLLPNGLRQSFPDHHYHCLYALLHHMACNSMLPLPKSVDLVFSNVEGRN